MLKSSRLSAKTSNHCAKFRVRQRGTKAAESGQMLSSASIEIASALSFEGCTAVVKMLTSERRS